MEMAAMDAKKEQWLRDASRKFPIGSRVRIAKSDLDEHIGMKGAVRGYDLGPRGESPLVSVTFDVGGQDGFYIDEIVRERAGRSARASSRRRGDAKHGAAPLTREQLGAVRRYAERHGRRWKERLRDVWMRADPRTDDEYIVYALRNTHGPSWLRRYQLRDG